MEKPAETQYPVHELIERRWSPLAFSAQAVEPEKLCSLLEAARWAASSYNGQPWSFIISTKENEREHARLLGCLVEGNRQWARHAPVLMLSIAKLDFDANNQPNRHAFHDVGQAVSSLALEATAQGLFIHQMAGMDVAKAREEFSIPEGYEPVAAIALGYAGDHESLPENLRAREESPRVRRAQKDFVFTGKWGQTSPPLWDEADGENDR